MEVVAVEDPMVDTDVLRERLDPEVTVRTVDPDRADLAAALAGASAFVVDVSTPVTADLLEDAPDLRLVARAGVGVDNVDVEAAAERDVAVSNVPEYCTREVATHAVALLFACARRVPQYDRDVRAGGWDWGAVGAVHDVTGATLGFASFGPIAREVSGMLSGFGFEQVAHDPYVDAEAMADHGVEAVSFEGLLDRAELVVVLAPLTEETRGLFDADALSRLSDTAVLVNAGRGGVVDEAALAAALEAGELGAAGLDVMAEEPPGDSPLLDREDAVVTPHAGWYSVEARTRLNEGVAENVAAALAGEEPPDRVEPDLDWV